ncbi:MAG: type II toxin-antitoxin system HicB family antitoxin [Kiritimatiellia bacterium]
MTATYTYWQDPKDGLFVGYWNDYPDFPTQGRDLPELQLMLRDVRAMIDDGTLVDEPRTVATMEFA